MKSIIEMQTGNNTPLTNTDISLIIQTALLNFKELSSNLKSGNRNGSKFSTLALYALLCLFNSKPLLRNDIQKKLRANYYDIGNALELLTLNRLITNELISENSNIKSINVKRKRFRLTLNGDIFVGELLQKIQGQ